MSFVDTDKAVELLIERADDYRDLGREYRSQDLYDAACSCEDKASGLLVAVKIIRKLASPESRDK